MEKEGGRIQACKTLREKRTCFHGKMDAPLFSWQWENFDNYKYLLYGPLVAKFFYSVYGEETKKDSWCLHVLILCALRGLVHQLWSSFSNMLFLNRTRRIFQQGIDFKQIDMEWHWDNFLILQAIVASLSYLSFPCLANLPIWETRGFICCLILHMVVSEPLYYWVHRLLHSPSLFQQYHWLHHSSEVPHPFTAGHATFLEHLILCIVIAIPILGTAFIGYGSISMMYSYALVFDFLRCLGHCNVEIIPHGLFETIPLLKYLIRTPTYHSLHHIEMRTNFCLFMPFYDMLGKTMNTSSWNLHKDICSKAKIRVPDFVFLAHVVDIMSAMHSPFVFRSFNATPFCIRSFLFPMWPGTFLFMLAMWAKSKTFLFSFYNLRSRLHQTWVVPRFGFQYFLPFAAEGINNLIEEAILRADRLGVKVLSLAALNKNEGLNGGGTLFINKHPNLKVRVVHGNTLTAGVILNAIPKDIDEVFLTGATSKLGRAIALYLAHRRVKVLMLTQSTERFMKIQKEAPADSQKFLVQVTKYQAAKHCKTWIIGKWTTPREQSWAPSGTHFHQFVVPPIIPFRRNCTYGKLAAMKLPADVEGLGSCEKMNSRISLLISLFLPIFLFCDAGAFNITKLLDQYPDFSTFNSYLTQTQVAGQINSRPSITIMAVDNGNISPLSGKPVDVLGKIMSLHVVLDYLDVKKLQILQKKTALFTTLYQTTGQAAGKQGFINVTNLSTGSVVFSSAVKSGTPGANLVKSILAEPYNISILQTSRVIVPVGGANNSSASSPSPVPAASPNTTPTPEISPSMPPPGRAQSRSAPELAPDISPSMSPEMPGNAPAPAQSDAPSNAPAPADQADAPEAGTPATAPTSSNSTPQPAPGSPPMPDAPTANAPDADTPSDTTTDAGTTLTFNLHVLMVLLVPSTLWLFLAV